VVAWDNVARGLIELSDKPRPTSKQAMDELKAAGFSPYLVPGTTQNEFAKLQNN